MKNWGKDFFMTAASSAFHIVGLRTICSEDMNAQCKYYWQPWLSDSTDVGVALLHKWEGFFDDTIVSAFHTTDLTIQQYSLHNFPPEMFTGKEQSPLEQFSVLKLCSEMKTNEISMQWLAKQSYFSKHKISYNEFKNENKQCRHSLILCAAKDQVILSRLNSSRYLTAEISQPEFCPSVNITLL